MVLWRMVTVGDQAYPKSTGAGQLLRFDDLSQRGVSDVSISSGKQPRGEQASAALTLSQIASMFFVADCGRKVG